MPLTSSQEHDADQEGVTDGEHAAPPTATVAPRKPTFLQKERWKAVQKARRKGMSLRAIERELRIHRVNHQEIFGGRRPSKAAVADGFNFANIGYHGKLIE